MNHSKKAALLGLCAVVGVVTCAFGAASLPYTNSMSISSITDGHWSPTAVASSGGVGVQDGNTISFTNDLSLSITPGTHSNCVITLFAKVALMSPDTVPASATNADVACAFYIDTSSNLIALSGSTWTTQAVGTKFGTNDWIGLRAHVNTGTKKWDLYYITNTFSETLTKANTAGEMNCNTYFVANSIGITNVTVSSELPAQLDYVVAASAFSQPGPIDPTANMVYQSQALGAGSWQYLHLIGNNYADNDNTLANSSLGNYLLNLLVEGDRIVVSPTNGPCYYTVSGGVLVRDGGAYPYPEDLHVTPGMPVQVWPTSPPAPRTITAYAYPSATNRVPTVIAYKGLGSTAGFTKLWWQEGLANADVNAFGGNNWGFKGIASAGDRMYLIDANGNYHQLYWNVLQENWMKGSAPASGVKMTTNQIFNFYRPFTNVLGYWTNQLAK